MAQGSRFPKQFLGKGMAFPFEVSAVKGGRTKTLSGVSISDGVERIRQSLLQILYTRIGERVMRRDFGSDFSAFLFEPLDRAVLDQIIYTARRAIDKWEPRVTIRKFEITLIDRSSGLLQMDVNFLINDTNTPGNLVFPFYLNDTESARQSVVGSEFLSENGASVNNG